MRHIALLAVSQCLCIIAFCQSQVIPSQTPQTPVNLPSSLQSIFDFNGGHAARTSPSYMLPTLPSRDALAAKGNLAAAKAGTGQLSYLPLMNPDIFALTAQNNVQTPPPARGHWPRAKSIPIPTQWPDLKREPIPTTWPNLKLLPIQTPNPAQVPAK